MISNKPIKEGFRWTTYAERLQKAGVSWKVYQQQDNYGCNMLEHFKTFKEADPDSALATRGPASAPPAPDPEDPGARLAQEVDDVYFPNWARDLGWRATGQRTDRLSDQ